MFKLAYNDLEKSFTKNKQFCNNLFKEKQENIDLFGTQLTVSYADRIGIFLAGFPSIADKIQSYVFQDLNEENIIRKILTSLINKEFGEFDTYQVLRISIAIIISITSKSKIDYPYEIVDINYQQNSHTVKLIFSSLIKFLDYKAIILLICGLSYVIEELHTNENFQYKMEDIEKILKILNSIQSSNLWDTDGLIYNFLVRLNFFIDFNNEMPEPSSILLLYVLKSVYVEIDFFNYICTHFAIDRWNTIFKNKNIYNIGKIAKPTDFLIKTKLFFPVFANLENFGFRIISGRSRNTGFGTVGVNPVILKLIKILAVSDQIKLQNPFNNYQVQNVDFIEGPYVQLLDKSCVRLNTLSIFDSYKDKVDKILSFGDLLVDEFDIPSEFENKNLGISHKDWVDVAINILKKNEVETISFFKSIFVFSEKLTSPNYSHDFLKSFLLEEENLITDHVAVELFKMFGIPIHPRWSPRWHKITNKEWRTFRKWIQETRYWQKDTMGYKKFHMEGSINPIVIDLLKQGEIPFTMEKEKIAISDFGNILYFLFLDKETDIAELEPAESIFNPIFFLNSSKKISFDIEERCRINFSLNSVTYTYIDSFKDNVHGFYPEPILEDEKTFVKKEIIKISHDLQIEKINFMKNQIHSKNDQKNIDLLRKTILRGKYELPIFKDGLIHFSLLNAPLSIFRPDEVNVTLDQLHSLGYYYDKDGKYIQTMNQEILLKPFDVIIPELLINDILTVMKFINEEINFLYQKGPYYEIQTTTSNIIGTNIIGINKNFSVGIYGRILGFSKLPVLLASPIWHLSKGSYCNGEMTDSFVLDLDCFLNLDLTLIISKAGMFRGIPIFTQIEPDLDLGNSILNKIQIENDSNKCNNSLNELDVDLSRKTMLKRLMDYNLYQKGTYFNYIERIDKQIKENSLKNLTDPIKQMKIFFENSKIFGTIDEQKIFNHFVFGYLSMILIPEIDNFFLKSRICPKCKNRIEILLYETCSYCGEKIEVLESFNSVLDKLQILKEFINQFAYINLFDYVKELINYSELQIQSY